MAQAELRTYASEKEADVKFLERERKDELRKKDELIETMKEEFSHRELAMERQLVQLQKKRDDDVQKLEAKNRELGMDLRKATETNSKALAEQARNLQEELNSMKKVVKAKEAEIDELRARHASEMKKNDEDRDSTVGALLKQLHEVDESWREAMEKQQNRSIELRKEDLKRVAGLENQLAESKEKVNENQMKHTKATREKTTVESDASAWNTKVLAQVDIMINSYKAPPPEVSVLAKDKPKDPMHERLWYRVLQLWELVKGSHEEAKKGRDKVENVIKDAADAQVAEKEKWEGRRKEMATVQLDLDDLKSKQDRLARAVEELHQHSDGVSQAEAALVHRLNFFLQDGKHADEFRRQPSSVPPPVSGMMACVYLASDRLPVFADKGMFKSSHDIFTAVVRSRAHARGAYEFVSKGDVFGYLFLSIVEACEFCLEVQLALHHAKWPEAIMAHPNRCNDDVWRGVCCKMAVHYGYAQHDAKCLLPERGYIGPELVYGAALLGKAAAGQVVLSGNAWEELKQHNVDSMTKAEVVSLGLHPVFSGTSGKNEPDRLMQLLPAELAKRQFPPITVGEAFAFGHQSLLCNEITKEVDLYKRDADALSKGSSVITEELEAIEKAVIVSTGKLRNMQLDRPWKQEDFISAFAAIDELMLRHDGSRKALEDALMAQEQLSKQQQGLEMAVTIHNEGMTTEEEYRREVEAVKQTCQQRMVALQDECKHEAQRLLNTVLRSDDPQQALHNAFDRALFTPGSTSRDARGNGSFRSRSGRAGAAGAHADDTQNMTRFQTLRRTPSGPSGRGGVYGGGRNPRQGGAAYARRQDSSRGRPLNASLMSPQSGHSRPDSFVGGLSFN
eukprot:TRINITY_DN29809_c0_g1_i1.p1 TRINITY_DN29809_c0_g1~~TRINITY_DN29809_c0_g1_i1.p1  ORF type:complete len:944 (+),score=388.39 TRINITY_DN29809_c0_g1_i1:287-2833(+)